MYAGSRLREVQHGSGQRLEFTGMANIVGLLNGPVQGRVVSDHPIKRGIVVVRGASYQILGHGSRTDYEHVKEIGPDGAFTISREENASDEVMVECILAGEHAPIGRRYIHGGPPEWPVDGVFPLTYVADSPAVWAGAISDANHLCLPITENARAAWRKYAQRERDAIGACFPDWLRYRNK